MGSRYVARELILARIAKQLYAINTATRAKAAVIALSLSHSR